MFARVFSVKNDTNDKPTTMHQICNIKINFKDNLLIYPNKLKF